MNEKKVTLQVVVSQNLADRIDYYANYMGMSRSGFCASIIGQGILGYDKVGNILENYIVGEISKKESK
ncbi:MAG TPA: hypothetical protein GX707_16780 [Epulopiscium sp.]|nr:hypothetical protein [Candidatus Epulonipiscium sp.]